MDGPKIALILGGGAARGLAHIGALEVLEREGIWPAFVGGSSMGGLIAALWAAGLDAAKMREVARGFRFPRWFVPGALVAWDRIFASAVPYLAQATFESLKTPLAVLAVDVESGRPVVLHQGTVLPAVRATCAIPAVLPPVALGGRQLVDGGLVNVLPVDLAAMVEPEDSPRDRARVEGARGAPGEAPGTAQLRSRMRDGGDAVERGGGRRTRGTQVLLLLARLPGRVR
jgi:NTE family protein